MGYIHDLEEAIKKRLACLEEVCKAGEVDECDKHLYEFIHFLKEAILTSYKNGVRVGKGNRDNSTTKV